MNEQQRHHASRQIVRSGQLLGIAELLLTLLAKEPFIKQGQRQALTRVVGDASRAKRGLTGMLTPQSRQLAEKEVLSEEKVYHICSVIDCLVQLPNEQTDLIAEEIQTEYERYQKEREAVEAQAPCS